MVEDEPQIGMFIAKLLEQMNAVSDVVKTIADAEHALDTYEYDLVIVDRMLPDGDAIKVVKGLGKLTVRPAVLMLTARDSKEDVIEGLNSGADDYLAKPFEPQEFLARARSVLRRPRVSVAPSLAYGNVTLNVGTNEASVADTAILLRRREALILETLLLRRDRVVTRNILVEAIYGFVDELESNSLEAQISRLRKKMSDLGSDIEIRSMRGIGYILRKVSNS